MVIIITLQCRSKDPYNKAVEKRIEEEIKLTKENSYSKILIESKILYNHTLYCSYCPFCQEPFKGIFSPAIEAGEN